MRTATNLRPRGRAAVYAYRARVAGRPVDWLKCTYCKEWSPPDEIRRTRTGAKYHLDCASRYQRERRALTKNGAA